MHRVQSSALEHHTPPIVFIPTVHSHSTVPSPHPTKALKAGLLQELTRGSRTPDGASTYFVSQTWEATDGSHPDNERNTKLRWLQNIKSNMRLQKGREVWIWFDIFSIPQKSRTLQARAVRSLPYYTQLCSRVVPLVRLATSWKQLYSEECPLVGNLPRGDESTYWTRGWCRLEILAALCPKKFSDGTWRPGPVGSRVCYHHNPTSATSSDGALLDVSCLLDPLSDDITYTCCWKAGGRDKPHDCDRVRVKPVLVAIALQYVESVESEWWWRV